MQQTAQTLRDVLREACRILEQTRDCAAPNDRLALEDQIQEASRALAGETPPFSRCRAFVRDFDPAAFALRHHTMAPTYLPDGAVSAEYGLKPALDWYLTRLDAPAPKPRTPTALASDRDPDCGGLYSPGELADLLKKARRNPLLSRRMAEIDAEADRLSLEQMEADYARCFAPDAYQDLNRTDCPWSDSNTLITFSAPAETRFARLTLRLEEPDNEAEGLGHLWVDDLRLVGAEGEFPVPNGGFEEGLSGWTAAGDCRVERRPGFCGSETASAFLCNPAPGGEASLTTRQPFPLTPGSWTLRFRAKVDGILRRGLRIELGFLDEQGRELGRHTASFAEKSWPTGVMNYNLTMQCCALRYAETGRMEYARKTKVAILHFLDNFCQGAEHWMVYNSRPGGSDAYGAVQGGRNLCAIAFSYAAVRQAAVFSDRERALFYRLIHYLLRYMMDLRDRAALGCSAAQHNTSNWQTDMCIGTAMMVSVLPDLPHRHLWWDNAYAVLRGQLETNRNPDGSWPESIRYHHAALEHFALYALLLRRETGEDWFAGTALPQMFGYSAAVQTPPMPYFEGRVGTPPFGDHKLSGGEDYALYAEFLPVLLQTVPTLGQQLARTWKMAGCSLPKFWGESVLAQGLCAPDPAALPSGSPALPEHALFPQAGIALWRGPEGNFLAAMCSPRKIGHGHLDQGSFVLFAGGVPLVADTGVEGYFDASTPWHLCSMSHACLQFHRPPVAPQNSGFINLSAGSYSAEHGLCDTPDHSRLLDCRADGMTMEIQNPCGRGLHRRELRYDSRHGVLTVRDTVTDYHGLVTVSLPLAVETVSVQGNTILCRGFYGWRLRIELLTPAERVWTEPGRSTRFFPSPDPLPQTQHLRIEAQARDGVTLRLTPEHG